jgi:iron(III) transport system ATP-binding protein
VTPEFAALEVPAAEGENEAALPSVEHDAVHQPPSAPPIVEAPRPPAGVPPAPSDGDTPAIEAIGLHRTFEGGGGVRDLSLTLRAGELMALLGASGCGKTTSLRLIAGYERAEVGELALWGEPVAGPRLHVPPERRGVGMVFQDYALFPHLSVAQNVAYGLRGRRRWIRGGERAVEREARVTEVLAMTGLAALADRGVHELSGGEQQRVALARALAPRPRLLLLDEPFSNLDPALRAQVRAELRSIVKRAGATALLVTHDQEEALSIADRVAFMWAGRVEQVGTPDEVYLRPATLHAATFIGDANIYRLPVRQGRVGTPFGEYEAPEGATRCAVVLRPEDLQVQAGGTAGHVVEREYYGHDQVLHVELGAATAGPAGDAPSERVRVRLGPHERITATGPNALGLRRDPLIFAE